MFSIEPMLDIVTLTTSPFFKNLGGLKPMPTPAGVPVAIISPGLKVMLADAVEIFIMFDIGFD